MGRVFQHSVAHLSTWIFESCLMTLAASRQRLFESTTIRCSLLTLGALSSSVIKASTRASGGYTPLILAQASVGIITLDHPAHQAHWSRHHISNSPWRSLPLPSHAYPGGPWWGRSAAHELGALSPLQKPLLFGPPVLVGWADGNFSLVPH